jgi:hypothetical protein
MNDITINEWPTQTQDMHMATEIINKYIELNGEQTLGLIEVVIDKSKQKPIEIRIPEWISEIIAHFRDHYGYEHGQAIASKVITRFLLKDETIH